jgi:hypothetical protein
VWYLWYIIGVGQTTIGVDMSNKRDRLITRLRKAGSLTKKTQIWLDADLSRAEELELVKEMILSLPKGSYRLYDGTNNLIDTIWEMYGLMPSMLISQSMLLGMQSVNEKKIYVSFTHGLDIIQIK